MRGYILLGLLGISLFAVGMAGIAYSQAAKEERHNPLHEQMHRMMDQMMGEGASHRMHEAMPGSEEMMEFCTGMMSDTNQTATMGPMGNMMGGGMMGGGNQTQGMMGGMGGMMGPGMMGNMMQGMMGR